MVKQWENWCRLCGQENEETFNIFLEDENFFNISKAIQKFLSININIWEDIPHSICSICHKFIISMLNFAEKSSKIQEMFLEIQLDSSIDLEALRKKYDLTNENVESSLAEENYVKVFIEYDDQQFENNLDKFSSTQEIKKKPKVRTKISKLSAVTIDEQTSLNNITDIDSFVKLVDESTPMTQDIPSLNHNTVLHDNDSIQTEKSNIYKQLDGNRQYYCDICDKQCTTQFGYRRHMKFKHSITIIIPKELYPCNACDKIFKTLRNLTEHKKLHLPPEERKWYTCPHCDKKFASLWYVSIHIRTVHEKERSYICEECGKTFASMSLLQNHKLVHTDLKPFQCTQCSNSFKSSRMLKHHFHIHEDTKYMCPICDAQLNTKKNLKLHMVIHSDEKKFKCKFCEKEFKRSRTLKNHLISHMGIKPYECSFCFQTFAHGSNCRKHQKVLHPIELAEQEKTGEKKICKLPNLEQLQAMCYIPKENIH